METETYSEGYDYLVYDPIEWADECAVADAEMKQRVIENILAEEIDESYTGDERWDDLSCESL